jgi:hypothetical protein
MGGAGMNNTIDNRREVLKTAVKHIEIWFSPTEWVDFERKTKNGTIQKQKRRPDTFWLGLFNGENSPEITGEYLSHFFQIFGLSKRVSWNWIKVILQRSRNAADFGSKQDCGFFQAKGHGIHMGQVRARICAIERSSTRHPRER